MVFVDRVIPVGLVDCVAGPGLLVVGELWFLLNVGWYLVLFDGVGVVRRCWWDGNKYVVGGVMECPVDELEVMRAAVVGYLEGVGGGV